MASNLDAVRQAIQARVKSNWTLCPVVYENDEGTPPEVGDDGHALWMRVDILWGDTFRLDMAGATQTVGVVQMTLYDKPGAGTGELVAAADAARDLFEDITLGAARFNVPSGPTPGAPEERWHSRVVRVTFDVIVD